MPEKTKFDLGDYLDMDAEEEARRRAAGLICDAPVQRKTVVEAKPVAPKKSWAMFIIAMVLIALAGGAVGALAIAGVTELKKDAADKDVMERLDKLMKPVN